MSVSDFFLRFQVDLVGALVVAVALIVWMALSRRAWAIFKRSVTHPATKEILEITDHEVHVRAVGGANAK